MALRPLLSKVRVTWIQALQYQNSWSDNQNGYYVTNGQVAYSVDMLDKEKIHVQGGMVQDFITLLRMEHDLKLMNLLFLEFSI